MVFYDPNGPVVVGTNARRELLEMPEAVIGSIKRLMGRGAADLSGISGKLPYTIDPSTAQGGMVKVRVGVTTLEEIITVTNE